MDKPNEKEMLRSWSKKIFCDAVEDIIPSIERKRVKIFITKRKTRRNGSVHIVNAFGHKRYVIFVNLWPLLHWTSASFPIKLFFLHTTIVHELVHIKLQIGLETGNMLSFHELFSAWNQLYKFGVLSIPVSTNLISSGEKKTTPKRRSNTASSAEYYCTLVGMNHAYSAVKELLSDDELSLVNTYIESAQFINDHFEITYGRDGYPRNLFVTSIKQMQRYMRARKTPFEKYPDLSKLFHQDGSLISPMEILQRIMNQDDVLFFRDFLLQLFIQLDCNWENLLSATNDLKTELATLSNDYCQNCIEFFTAMKLGAVLVPEFVLQDNAASMMRCSGVLSAKMKAVGIERTSGGALPLY